MMYTLCRLCGILMVLLVFFPGSYSQSITELSNEELFNQKIESLRQHLKIPGLSYAIVKDKQVIISCGLGFADIKKAIPCNASTCYQLASITKPLAASVIMKLVEDGILFLDQPVAGDLQNILSHYGIKTDEAIGEIKIKHLLSHTSDNPAGTYFRYDGDKYSLLSEVIKKRTGKTFEEWLEEIIIKKTGMEHTASIHTILKDPSKWIDLSTPYLLDSTLNPIQKSYKDQFNCSTGLVSSVEDLARFLLAIENNTIISKNSKELAQSPFILKSGSMSNYGLGWNVENINNEKIVWHSGYGYYSSGLILSLPGRQLHFIILANCNLLSKPFPIGLPMVSVIESPFALEFLKTFVWGNELNIPEIDWGKPIFSIQNNLISSNDPFIKNILVSEALGLGNIARTNHNGAMYNKCVELYRYLLQDKDIQGCQDKNLITEIKVSRKGHFHSTFKLEEPSLIHIKAIADGGYCDYFGMYDNVWIENSETGDKEWQMNSSHTEEAGGHPRNRIANLVLALPLGLYSVHYNNLSSPYNHYPGHWESMPPVSDFWGIRITTP